MDDRLIASVRPKRVPPARALESIASLIAPPLCAACGSPRPAEVAICERCRVELASAPRVIDPGPPGVDLAVSASPFDGVARWVVHGLKFGRRLSLAGVAAEAMLRALPDRESADGVVPVPAAPWRWRWRGFDPAEEIAIALSEHARLPYRPCLRRDRGRRQVGRRRSARLTGGPRVWAVADAPGAVLLVDDVWTTGATLAACAAALRAAGSRTVVALTLAHAL